MAKSSIRTYSTTAASNTDVGGVDIQGTAPASNMDDAVREVMSHLAETNAGTAPVDDLWSFCDPSDATKKFRLDAGAITAGNTRIVTVPDASGVLVFVDGAQILTNKTLTSPVITGLDASTTDKGLIELATTAEAQAGTDSARAITPATLQDVTATTARSGVVELATTAEAAAGTDTARAVTPAGLAARFVAGTAQASTSGTAIDFTSIPSWVKRITLSFAGISTNGTSKPIVQLGDSGGVETSGYLGAVSNLTDSDNVDVDNHSTGFGLVGKSPSAANVLHGAVVLTLIDASTFTWAAAISGGYSNTDNTIVGGGSKSLSATLDRVRLTTVNGTDTFDAGKVNILYE